MPVTLRLLISTAWLMVAGPVAALALEPPENGRITIPIVESVGDVTAVTVRCRRDFSIGLQTASGRLRPDRDVSEEEKLFDTLFGTAVATVDGRRFPLIVGGPDRTHAAYVFAEDQAGLLAALYDGDDLTVAFDILPENAPKGKGVGFETTATVSLAAVAELLAVAGAACERP